MTDADRPRFARLMTILAETIGQQVSAGMLEGYWLALEDLSVDDVTRAVEAAMRVCEFFPRPVKLRELAGDTVPDPGQVEVLLIEHLSQPGGERRTPRDPFVALVTERLGGVYHMAGMDSSARIAALRSILPGVAVACRERGIGMPRNLPSAYVLGLLSQVGQSPCVVSHVPSRAGDGVRSVAALTGPIGRRIP